MHRSDNYLRKMEPMSADSTSPHVDQPDRGGSHAAGLSAWNEHFLEFRKFHKRYGRHLFERLPASSPLMRWIRRQRERIDLLSSEQIDVLLKAQFPFARPDAAWLRRYQQLCAYKARFGHTHVPKDWKEDPPFGVWAVRQKVKRNILSAPRTRLLNSLGFQWELLKQYQRKLADLGFVWD